MTPTRYRTRRRPQPPSPSRPVPPGDRRLKKKMSVEMWTIEGDGQAEKLFRDGSGGCCMGAAGGLRPPVVDLSA